MIQLNSGLVAVKQAHKTEVVSWIGTSTPAAQKQNKSEQARSVTWQDEIWEFGGRKVQGGFKLDPPLCFMPQKNIVAFSAQSNEPWSHRKTNKKKLR